MLGHKDPHQRKDTLITIFDLLKIAKLNFGFEVDYIIFRREIWCHVKNRQFKGLILITNLRVESIRLQAFKEEV
jgi:hypothetical protein